MVKYLVLMIKITQLSKFVFKKNYINYCIAAIHENITVTYTYLLFNCRRLLLIIDKFWYIYSDLNSEDVFLYKVHIYIKYMYTKICYFYFIFKDVEYIEIKFIYTLFSFNFDNHLFYCELLFVNCLLFIYRG